MMGSPDRVRSRSPRRAIHHMESMNGNNAVNDGTRDDKANRDGVMRKLPFICMNDEAFDLLASIADTWKDVRDQLLDVLKLQGLSVKLCMLPIKHGEFADDRVVGDVPCQVFRLVILKLTAVSCVGPAFEKPKKYGADQVRAENGKLYFAPNNACQALSIDTASEVVEMFGPAIRGYDKYYAAGVCAENGKIYFVPHCASHVLSIDSRSGAAELLNPEMEEEEKYLADGVHAKNGKIYFAPDCASQVLSIDPSTGAVEIIGPRMDEVTCVRGYMARSQC